MPTEKIPLVSVVIPMYNSEKFISQTLESLLYQTMKDFEIVIVDDRSTDNSVAIVESLARHFGGRLHLIKLPENSGSGAIPRNVGINFARGKYIAFMDNDDLFTPTALEELSTLAEEHQADVVHTDKFFCFGNEQKKFATTKDLIAMNHVVIKCNPKSKDLTEPTDKPEDLAGRLKLWLNSDFHWATWALFCRKDFWVTNQISFPQMTVSDDMIANFACLCLAKKSLRVPNVTYIYRERADSVSHDAANIKKYFHKWLKNLNDGFNELNKLMGHFKFFNEHPDYRYAVLNWFFNRVITDARQIPATYTKVHPAALNQFVEQEFHADNAALAAYLFNVVNIQRQQLMRLQTENVALKKIAAQQ